MAFETISAEQFKERYGQQAVDNFSTPTEAPQEGAFASTQERLAEVGVDVAGDITGAIAGTGEFEGQSPIRRGVEATASAFSAVPRGALALAPEPIRKGIQAVGEKIGSLFGKGIEKIAETSLFEEIGRLEAQGFINPQDNPEFFKLKDTLGTVSASGEIAGTIAGAEAVVGATVKTLNLTNKTLKVGATKLDEAKQALQGIELPSTAGIKKAVDLGLSPEDMMQRVARISKGKQAKFEDRANESVGSYLVQREIFGTPDQIVDQLWKRFNDSKGRLDTGLAQVKGNFKNPVFKDALDQLIVREGKISTTGTSNPQQARITELAKKHKNEGLTLTEANEVKRLYEANVKVDFLKDINSTGVAKANNVSTAMRKFIVAKADDGGFSEVTSLNRETSLARQLVDDLGAEYAGSAGNNVFGLADTIFLAEALGNPVAAVGLGIKKGLGSKAVQAAIAKKRAGAGAETELPSSRVQQPDPDKLSGFLQFLEDQVSNQTSQ